MTVKANQNHEKLRYKKNIKKKKMIIEYSIMHIFGVEDPIGLTPHN